MDQPQPTFDVSGDRLLEVFASVALGAEAFSMGVTLVVNGALVTGHLISPRLWFTLLREQAATATGDGAAEFLKSIDGTMQQWYDEAAKDPDQAPPGHLHLRAAAVRQGSHVTNVGLWRGRISQVDGWTLGVPT